MNSTPTPLDLLCCGAVCLDLVYVVERHPGPDEKIRSTKTLVHGGGLAANAAVQAARLGCRVGLIGRVGADPFGDQVRRELEAEGLDLSGLATVTEPTAVSTITVKPDGARTIVTAARPDKPAPLNVTAPDSEVLLVDGHEIDVARGLVESFRARGRPVILDADSHRPETVELATGADYVLASATYARAALGCEPDEKNIAALARPGAAVVVTIGEKGAIWSRENRTGHVLAVPVTAVDTTGAGDAFHGAFAAAIARNAPWAQSLREANTAGALCCRRLGARPGLPDRIGLDAFLQSEESKQDFPGGQGHVDTGR